MRLSGFAGNIVTCHRCKNRMGSVCGVGKLGLADHARQGCPLNLFQPAPDPVPTAPARPPMAIPDDFDVEAERRRLRAGGCCGPPSE